MIRTLVLSEHDLAAWRTRFSRGEVPARLPYGIEALETHGFFLTGVRPLRSRFSRKLEAVIDHRVGFPVTQTVRALPRAFRTDLVIALLEHHGYLASLWRQRGLPPYAASPLALMSVWLGETIRTAQPEERVRLAKLLAGADLITHFSEQEADVYRELGISQDRISAVPFGVNHRFYTPPRPGASRDISVLAVGQDRGRDYSTLFAAVRGTSLRLQVICQPENIAGMTVPPNVVLRGPVSLADYRDLLRRAQVVAVPTHDLAYPTGQSVALEAAASGCAVIVTETRAMREYFSGDESVLVAVGDVSGWREALIRAVEDPVFAENIGQRARRRVEERFNSDMMWAAFAAALASRGIRPDLKTASRAEEFPTW